jgi:hypothetical protein
MHQEATKRKNTQNGWIGGEMLPKLPMAAPFNCIDTVFFTMMNRE